MKAGYLTYLPYLPTGISNLLGSCENFLCNRKNFLHLPYAWPFLSVSISLSLTSSLSQVGGIHYFKCFFFVSKLLRAQARVREGVSFPIPPPYYRPFLSFFFQKVELRKCILFQQLYTFNLSTFFNFPFSVFLSLGG
uniref:Uncharacterized protein n=1 Tax=Cacopsylla melanoneura TaxID=428564 RepID=A0A8D9E8V5_9HEMI